MLLLDTCAFLWLVVDQKKLSENALKAIQKHQGALFVSAITALEIGLKRQRGRITLPLPVFEWYSDSMEFHGISELPVTGKIAIEAALLPIHHTDPCDRIIIATAKENGMKIITSDSLFKLYKQADIIW
jgi:PIN domain nuclease of toxin-antitoxin system